MRYFIYQLTKKIFEFQNKFVKLLFLVLLMGGASIANSFELVHDGNAIAVIVIPDNAFGCVKRAAWELQYHVKES